MRRDFKKSILAIKLFSEGIFKRSKTNNRIVKGLHALGLSNLEEHPRLILLLATIAVGPAAILVRFTLANDASVIAFWRVLFAGIGSMVISFLLKEKSRIPENTKEMGLMALAGLSLGLHFTIWFESLRYVSVAISVLVVTTTPVWMALAAWIFMGIHPTKLEKISIVLVFLAISTMTLDITGENRIVFDTNLFIGVFLALISSWFVVLYFFIARKILASASLWGYFGFVNLGAAFSIGIFIIISGAHFVPSIPSDFLIFAGLAIGPSLIGHAGYNYSMKISRPHDVGFAILGEPIIATVLAYIFFGEVPSIPTTIGACFLFLSIYLVVVVDKQAQITPEPIRQLD